MKQKYIRGTEEMLEMLKGNGKYIALATSKPLPMAEEVLKYLKIYSYFDKVMGAELKDQDRAKLMYLKHCLMRCLTAELRSSAL